MTDFSRNQLTSVRMNANVVDRWVVPNDRQLCLRAKLGAGWSVRTNRSKNYSFHHTEPHTLSDEELCHIHSIVARAADAEQKERHRIGTLVSHYQRLQGRCRGDGTVSCYLCNTKFHRFKSNCRICSDCASSICIECFVETVNTCHEKLILCKICSEKRELWKKSGAWFYGNIPPHADMSDSAPAGGETRRPITPHTSPVPTRRELPVSRKSSVAPSITAHETASHGFGEEVQIHIIKCRADSDDSDEDSSSLDSIDSYSGHFLRSNKPADPDTISITSTHLKFNPLLSSRKSDEESNTSNATCEDREFSGTESLQDLRQISLLPTNAPEGNRLKLGVTFHADNVSEKSGSVPSSPMGRFDGNMLRCQSVADADLKDVQYHVERDTSSPYGSIIFTMFYKEQEETLEIEMLAAQNLPDTGPICNAYVSINLVPSLGNSRKQRTSTKTNTQEPQWNQKIVYFGVSLDDLLDKSLIFSVVDERLIGSNYVIGEHRMPLRAIKSHELTHYHVQLDKKVTLPSDEAVAGYEKGRIQLAIRYDTTSAQLYVGVVRCVALYTLRRDGYADPYVKLYLQPDNSKAGKRKTAMKKKTLNPDFHEEFIYKVGFSALTKRSLEVSVWDNNIPRNVFMGGISISLKSKVPTEKRHWSDVIAQSNRRHDSWHQLRDIVHK